MSRCVLNQGVAAFFAVCAVVVFATPEEEFDAAVKANEPLTAENAFRRIIAEKSSTTPIRYFQAAEVARQMGRESLRRDRLAAYLRAEKGWNASVEEAAWYLCANGGTAEQFERLAKAVPESNALWGFGRDLFFRARDAKRGLEATKVAEALLEKFTSDGRRLEIMTEVVRLRFDNVPGVNSSRVRELILKYPFKDLGDARDRSLRYLVQRQGGEYPAAFRLEWCRKLGTALPADIFGGIASFDERSAKEIDKLDCKQLARLMKDVEPIVRREGFGPQALTLLRCEMRLAPYFFKEGEDEARSQAFVDKFLRTAACYGKGKVSVGEMRRAARDLYDRKLLTPAGWQKLRGACPDLLDDDLLIDAKALVEDAQKAKSVRNIQALAAKCPDRADRIRRRTSEAWVAYGDAKTLLGDLEGDFLRHLTDDIDGRSMLGTLSAMKISDPEKVEFLKRVYTRIGAHSFFNWLKKEKKAQDLLPALKGAAGQNFLQTIDEKRPAGDLVVRRAKEFLGLRRGGGNSCPDRAHELMAEAFAAYQSSYPQDGRSENAFIDRMLSHYFGLCRDNVAASEKFASVLLKGFGRQRNARWDYLRDVRGLIGRGRNDELYRELLDRLAEMTDDADIWEGVRFPEGTDALPASCDLEKADSWTIYSLLRDNVGVAFNNGREKVRFTESLKVKVAVAVFRRFNVPAWSAGRAAEMLKWLGTTATNHALVAEFPFEKVAGEALYYGKGWQPGLAPDFIEFAGKSGRRDACLKLYLASLAKADPCERFNCLVRLTENGGATPYTANADDKFADWYGEILEKHFLPAMRSVPDAKAPLLWFVGQTPWWMDRFNRYFGCDLRKNDKSAQKLRGDILCELSRLVCHGLRGVPVDWGIRAAINQTALSRALGANDVAGMVQVADMVGRDASRLGVQSVSGTLGAMRKAEAWGPLFLMANAIPGDANGELTSLATRYRGEAATKLPGVYPVDEKDPAYPLYVAADDLARKNTEGALKILNKNVAVFERELLKLPPDFVAWGVDQLRVQRGSKDALLLKARQLATAVIAAESRVTPDLVAAMILVRAECFRDQQNFEAAKLEYQSIRDNPNYHKTPSGRKAMYRAVDLQIESGQGQQAEQTLEYWLSQPDSEIQAQAHYFLARIAFDRKDYEECIKQLKEVFAINLTHTEARFLQGKWKLATNSEVDETDVWIGQLSDRTAIRPGQQLAITVQDRNLSVAGGGSSIPIVVSTDKGRDVENVFLYPSARDPNLFKGLIDVRLGRPAPSNTVLEVRGDDIASYVIAPEFLRARGLARGEAKRLKVVDDARLAIGAGMPRTEEADSEAQIEAMVSEEKNSEVKALDTVLRPGNPLYIAVADKDRSCGGASDTVEVSVRTTSGDRLDHVSLTEVRPFSGIFRGVVPTALPPPRAFASDTAAGFNAGDVINSTRDGLWRSLADGQPVKWFTVDTMGSHVVSKIVLKMVAPEEITALKLMGELGGENIAVATLPASDPKAKVGLRFQTDRVGNLRGEAAMREHMTRAGGPKAEEVKEFAYRPKWNDQPNTARFSGAFLQPGGYDYLRLRVTPLSEAPDALKDLSVSVLIDGRGVFTGRGVDVQNAAFIADMEEGVHTIEVFATARSTANDAFKLQWEPLGEDPRDLPMDWFDAAKHREILDFVSDKAVIRRTPDGFEADFTQPVRLRKIRWEFTGRRSPDVAIRSMAATDTDGRQFLPVTSDFSDALSNGTLEVAPGDQIVVQYADEVTASGTKRVLERSLTSRFSDGGISISFEMAGAPGSDGVPRMSYHEAYRFTPGDTLAVVVTDPDLDISEKADEVEVTVKSSLDGLRKLRLIEQTPGGDWKPGDGVHTRRFLGLIKTIPESAAAPTNGTGKVLTKLTLRTKDDDTLSVSYVDRENTKPGVPCPRTASVLATKPTTPRLTLFHTRQARVADNSEEARQKLAAIRKRAGNEKVEKVFRTTTYAVPMTQKASSDTNAIPMNIAAPILVRVNDPSRARHDASRLLLEAVTERELERAEAEGDDPVIAQALMTIGGSFGPVQLKAGAETGRTALRAGTFNGYIHLAIGSLDALSEEVLQSVNRRPRGMAPNALAVYGNDIVHIRVLDGEEVLAERTLSFVSNGSLALLDSTYSAERDTVHIGERFFVQVQDADRDGSDEADRILIDVKSAVTGRSRKLVLTETIPHSGIFNGVVRPILFPESEQIPLCVTGGAARVEELVSEDRFAANYGDRLLFSYRDEVVLPGSDPRTLCATGHVYKGSDGSVRLFSKRFRDNDQAVLVQFRLAECLFEQAKDFRKLKKNEKSSEAIAKGRFILEEALKNFPDSAHVMQGEFLLANLFQELAAEQREAKNEAEARRLFTDALSRFSTIVAAWPDGEYAARAQYHKAYCLEMLADYRRSAEEYVKMTYLYPESELVGDATIRLATHYYTREKRYDVSARIYENFQRRFPQHGKASRALFMCGSCYIKQAEAYVQEAAEKAKGMEEDKRGALFRAAKTSASDMYGKAAEAFERIGEIYRATATPELRAQALYWAGDAYLRGDNAKQAYRSLKRCVLEYPETEWARRARGLLLQEGSKFGKMED